MKSQGPTWRSLEASDDRRPGGAAILNHHHGSAEELGAEDRVGVDRVEVRVVGLVELLHREGEVRLVQAVAQRVGVRALLAEVRRCGADARAARGVLASFFSVVRAIFRISYI